MTESPVAASPAPVTFEAAPEVEKIESVDPGVSTVPQWETVDPTAQASWHKAETEPFHEAGPVTQSTDSGERTLANLRTAELISTGIRDSDSIKADEGRQVNVDIKGGVCHFCHIFTQIQNTGAIPWLRCLVSLLFSLWLCPNSSALSH